MDTTVVSQDKKISHEEQMGEAGKIRYLEDSDFELFETESGSLRLTLAGEKSYVKVYAKRCFPFSQPSSFISLRGLENEEIGIIAELDLLDKRKRMLVEKELANMYFIPVITELVKVKSKFGNNIWNVLTERGEKRFITKGLNDTMVQIGPQRYLITDIEGNRYELDVEQLDEASARYFETLL